MSLAPSIEERISALEREMDRVKRELARRRKEGDWLEKITGRFKDDPVFDEIDRLGAEIRRADRPPDDDGSE